MISDYDILEAHLAEVAAVLRHLVGHRQGRQIPACIPSRHVHIRIFACNNRYHNLPPCPPSIANHLLVCFCIRISLPR